MKVKKAPQNSTTERRAKAGVGRRTTLQRRLDEIFSSVEGDDGGKGKARLARPKVPRGRDIGFLKRSSLFGKLRDEDLRKILSMGKVVDFPRRSLIFKPGESCHAVLVIQSGVVQIRRPDEDGRMVPAALLGEGDVLGDVGILVGGEHRSEGLAPEGCELLVIDRVCFERILRAIPGFVMPYIESLAHRALGCAMDLDQAMANRRNLEGSLEFFDLSTLIQSLTSAEDRSGVLVFRSSGKGPAGRILIRNGQLLSADFRGLDGEEGIYELFTEDPSQLRFSFEEMSSEEILREVGRQDLSCVPVMTLLMEASRLRDELQRMEEQGKEPLPSLRKVVEDLEWDDPGTLAVARDLWELIGYCNGLDEFCGRLPYCRAKVKIVLQAMVDRHLVM